MPPKRKQASEPDALPSSKKLRSRAVPFPVDPSTKFDTAESRRDQLKSSPRKKPKAPVKADPTNSNNESDDICNAAREPSDESVQSQLPTVKVTKVYGKVGKQKKSTVTQEIHALESHSPVVEREPPIRRQSRLGTSTVEVVLPVGKTPKRAAKREASASTANTVERIIPVVEVPPRRSTRHAISTTAVIQAGVTRDEIPHKPGPKKNAKRKASTSAMDILIEPDEDIVEVPQRRTTRRTATAADTDTELANSLSSPSKKRSRQTKSFDAPKAAVVIADSSPNELAETSNNRTPSPNVWVTDEVPTITTHKPPLIDENADLSRNSLSPPPIQSQVHQFKDTSGVLPLHLRACFYAQKRVIMRMLQHPTYEANDPELEGTVNDIAAKQLVDLIEGTVVRAEGNSCLLLGPRGSGKSNMVEGCLDSLPSKPVILRLSGWVQSTDRHALREIAIQLLQQTGSALLSENEMEPKTATVEKHHDEDNPFFDDQDELNADSGYSTMSLPPASHLHSLIPALLTLKRPVIVILDAFDLFALHPRQALLYCLLDTVQNCRASSENRGIAVIGVTSRLDTVQLLEKRVKSRFSGRIVRTAPPNNLDSCLQYARISLRPLPSDNVSEEQAEWNRLWNISVEKFFEDDNVLNVFKETYSITREPRAIARILMNSVLLLDLSQPYLTHKHLLVSTELQRSRPPNLHLENLSYPAMCLVIASVHLNTNGQPNFTFEMLFEIFRDEVRASQSVPLQVNGGSIGMVSCTRDVSMTAFENLISTRIFIHISGLSVNTSKQFMRYRCVLDKGVITKMVDQLGQINLKRWHSRAK